MSRYEPRQLAPLPQEHALRGVVDELRKAQEPTGEQILRAMLKERRDAQRPPGQHITFPEVSWPEPLPEPPQVHSARPRHVPLVVEMIEPPRDRLTPWLFWLIIVVCFGCVLARAEGWL